MQSHEHINPNRIVPLGPALDFMRPHERARMEQRNESNIRIGEIGEKRDR
jgi:hypothetical protein